MQVVIMAGGVGKRLWPISRRNRPKQFQPLLSNRTMLLDTYERVLPLTSPDKVWAVTGADFVELTRRQLPEVPGANVLGEPASRNSAPAAALAAARIARDEPDATVLVTPADSYIGDAAAYRDYVAVAAEAAAAGFIVTLGVVPSHPETGYGYIQRGERLPAPVVGAYRVTRFIEKPEAKTAARYISEGGYYWNIGHFVFKAEHFMDRCAVHLPEVAAGMRKLAEAGDRGGELIEQVYQGLPSVSLDYGIAEKEENLAVVPTAIEWSDVGHWRAVKEIAGRRGALDTHPEDHVGIESEDAFVIAGSGRLVVTVGLEGYILVDTPDALLVVREDRAQEVRKALEEIKRRGREEQL